MRRIAVLCGIFALIALGLLGGQNQQANATGLAQQPNIPRGGALYDNWFVTIGKNAPDGNQPIWARQTTNTASGADTWRCISCHGWDYQGKDGAYRSGTNYTGFPGILAASQSLSKQAIIDTLSGKNDSLHDFSQYMASSDLNDLADFLKNALIDDNQYIDLQTMDVIGGDIGNGNKLYTAVCAACHGEDGAKLKFRFEGVDAGLGTLAALDPWRFLHKTRYGTPGTPMPIGATANPPWTAQDGRDVLLYAQKTFKTGLESANPTNVIAGHETPLPNPGGAQGVFGGLGTAFGALTTSIVFALLLGAVLVIIIFLVVWSMRGRK
jgi:hypothetical protein